MAQIVTKCTRCGADISLDDKSDNGVCGSCGATFSIQRTVVVTETVNIFDENGLNVEKGRGSLKINGYARNRWGKHDVEVFVDGKPVGTVGAKETLVVDIDKNCTIDMKFNSKPTRQKISLEFRKDEVGEIQLLWNSLGMLKYSRIK